MARTASAPARYHWADFVALAEGDARELIDGHLHEIDMPTKLHERIVALLIEFLGPWARRHGLVVLGSGFKVRISDRRGAIPDVQLLTRAVYEAADANGLERGHPEMVVEVVSPSSRAHDRVRKLEWYAHIGVPEYWIVDVDACTIERLVLAQSVYSIAQTASGDTVFRPKSMRGLAIPTRELWPARRG